jgi:hypothetical protein
MLQRQSFMTARAESLQRMEAGQMLPNNRRWDEAHDTIS